MGGSKRQTVGYWYPYDMQFGLAYAIDAVLELRGGDATAWQGRATSNQTIQINAPNLWGGEDRGEGGIVGPMDVLMGHADQQPHPYLQAEFDQHSAMRGKATLLFRNVRYGAYNPYPKPPSIKVERTAAGWPDDSPWYPSTLAIPLQSNTTATATALYLALDVSGSMAGTRLSVLKEAMGLVLDELGRWLTSGNPRLDVCLVAWSSGATQIQRVPLTPQGISDLRTFVDGLSASGGTSATAAFGGVESFLRSSPLTNRVVVCVSDGAMSNIATAQQSLMDLQASIGRIEIRGVGIQTAGSLGQFDNSGGPVPVVSGTSVGELAAVVIAAMSPRTGAIGVNAAHLLLYSKISPTMESLPRLSLDDAHWRAQADRLYAEGFGLCTEWIPGSESVEGFQQRICDCIGGYLVRSRRDGRWRLNLARGGAAQGDLPVLGDEDILDWAEQPSVLDDAVNALQTQWFDPVNKEESITPSEHALASIEAFGGIVSETYVRNEIASFGLAARVNTRQLTARSTPLRRITLTCTRAPELWEEGTYFRLECPRRGIDGLVMLVVRNETGESPTSAVRLTVIEDIYSMPDAAFSGPQEPIDYNPSPIPLPARAQQAFEAPYVELAATLSNADLAALPSEAGFLHFVAARPESGSNFSLITAAAGEAFDDAGAFDWCPTAVVEAAAIASDTHFTLSQIAKLDAVALGTAALWEEEIVRVDQLDLATGEAVLARGCADTIPAPHAAGSRIWFYDEWAVTDQREYALGELVSAKALTRTSSDRLNPDLAPISVVEMRERAARPYPPANLRINGTAAPGTVVGDIDVSWVHRDRLLQANQLIDASMGDIGPEAGTHYTVHVISGGSVLFTDQTEENRLVVPAGVLPNRADLRVEVITHRDGLPAWQVPGINFEYGDSDITLTVVFPLTYDELDGENQFQLQRFGGAVPHITPRGFDGDGYAAMYVWSQVAAHVPVVQGLQATVGLASLRALSARDDILCLGEQGGAPWLGFAVVQDARGSSLVPAGVVVLQAGSQSVPIGRPGWRYEMRYPEIQLASYTGLPQGIVFLDDQGATYLTNSHFQDTESVAWVMGSEDHSVLGRFSFGTSTYRHVCAFAKRSNGEVWAADYETSRLLRIDVDSSVSSGQAVILQVIDATAIADLGGVAFVEIGGVEYVVLVTYNTLDANTWLYIFPSTVLDASVLAIAGRVKRFLIGRRVQGICARGDQLLVARNNLWGQTSPSGVVGWLQQLDLAGMVASLADGATVRAGLNDQYLRWTRVGPSSYVEDLAVHPVTGRVYMPTEGASAVNDVQGYLGMWSCELAVADAVEENTYRVNLDTDGATAFINGFEFAHLAGVSVDAAAEVLSIGGRLGREPGYGNGFSFARVSNVALSSANISDVQEAAIAAGSFEKSSLQVHRVALSNPGAEAGVSGWLNEVGALGVRDASPPAYEGARYFFAGPHPVTRARQSVALASIAPAELRETDGVWARLRWMQSAYSDQDPGGMGLRAVDSGGLVIQESMSPSVWTPGGGGASGPWWWYPRYHGIPVGLDADQLQVVYNADTRTSGTNNDLYVDLVSLTVYSK